MIRVCEPERLRVASDADAYEIRLYDTRHWGLHKEGGPVGHIRIDGHTPKDSVLDLARQIDAALKAVQL